mmetsp:Transcript_86941/g.241092  ORF Transcript_86941/g.241092 Transcript_86941/m.241092 type:complete len:258 (+) Transcript_86941:1127-1900(+)
MGRLKNHLCRGACWPNRCEQLIILMPTRCPCAALVASRQMPCWFWIVPGFASGAVVGVIKAMPESSSSSSSSCSSFSSSSTTSSMHSALGWRPDDTSWDFRFFRGSEPATSFRRHTPEDPADLLASPVLVALLQVHARHSLTLKHFRRQDFMSGTPFSETTRSRVTYSTPLSTEQPLSLSLSFAFTSGAVMLARSVWRVRATLCQHRAAGATARTASSAMRPRQKCGLRAWCRSSRTPLPARPSSSPEGSWSSSAGA